MSYPRTCLAVAAVAALAGAPAPAPVRPLTPVAVPEASADPALAAAVRPAVRPAAGPAVVVAAPSSVPAPVLSVPPPRRGRPWFATPQRAMRYLAAAYGAHDDRALAKVTTPSARSALLAMRSYAPTLTLTSCTRLAAGDYECAFTHTLAKPSAGHRHGYATFLVAPAVRHGWYMTVLEDCGDGE